MTMKLIMESWRQHINEIGMSQAALGLSDEEYEKAMKPASMRPLDELSAKEIYDIISFIDPTQITAYPEAALAIKNFTDKPNWFNAAIVTVSLLAIIPLFGKLAKAGKLSMLTKRADSISKKLKTSKDSNLIKKADEISAKVKEFNQEAERLLNKTKGTNITATSKIISKSGDALPIKKVNISKIGDSVDRVTALGAAAKTLFKGKVGPDDIILFRGIDSDTFNLPGGTSVDGDALAALAMKGWDLGGKKGYSKAAHASVSGRSRRMLPQFFSSAAETAADYALKGGRSNKGALIAIRIPREATYQYAADGLRQGAKRIVGSNFAIPPEVLNNLKKTGDIGAIFF
jgi:hypothetical protein